MRAGRRLWQLRLGPRLLALIAIALLSLVLAACGASTPSQPPQPLGGSYTNGEFHFSVTYPSGWEANEWQAATPAAGAPSPLTVIITRSGATQENNSLVSNLTITILDLRNPKAVNPDVLKAVNTRATNPAYHAVTLAGRTAYATQPVQTAIYGTSQMETHTDYYLLANSFEYHLSTDVLAGDNADDAIKSMLASFTLTS